MKKLSIVFLLISSIVRAQNFQGPLSPGLANNSSCPFSYSSIVDYLPVENVFTSDDLYATASHCDCCDANTRCFEIKGYGFTIPSTATIDGIVVEIEKKATAGSMVQDNGLKLLNAGTVVGESKATADNWPAEDAFYTYGSPADLWGASWSPEEINDSSFGVALASISYTCFGNGNATTSYIDFVRITVYFTDVATSVSTLQGSGEGQVIISPNPSTTGTITISLPKFEREVTITISDIAGRIVQETHEKPAAQNTNVEVALPKGIYMVSIQDASNIYNQKLIVE